MSLQIEHDVYDEIERIVAADQGGRGIRELVRHGSVKWAAESLSRATSVVVTTGFCVTGAGFCETDGPLGAFALGHALVQLGRKVYYLSDSHIARTLEEVGLSPLVVYGPGCLEPLNASHLVAVERPGRAADGCYYTMRGEDITAWTAPIDELFINSHAPDLVTIAIGDGGNEVGMGLVRAAAARAVRGGSRVASVVTADCLVVSGVSNWGAWGVVAALSVMCRRNLLPLLSQARDQLERLVDAGAVDGVNRTATLTVDGLSWELNAQVLLRLHDLVHRALSVGDS